MKAKPNKRKNTTERYKAVVREYLRDHKEFASKEELRDKLAVPDWYFDSSTFQEIFYTSLTHRGKYVASKNVIGHRADRQGFWRPEEAEEDIVFHQQEVTKETLTYLACNRPAGLTAKEAKDLLARPCYRALDDLVEEGRIVEESVADTRCFFHPWQDDRETQVSERESEFVEDISPADDPDDHEYLYLDEILDVMTESADESVESIPPTRAATLVLRQLQGDTFRAVERRLRRNDRLQEPLGYDGPTEVPDSTTFWRAHDGVAPDELREWLQEMCAELLAEAEQSGRFAVVDATDVDAWANTRQEIDDGDVEGASWGQHEGSFYGYKAFILVDVAIEQPILIRMETGSRNDSPVSIPLIKEYEQRYDTDKLEAVLADAGFDSAENREACQDRLGCPFLHPINPRRSKPLKTIRDEIKQVFQDNAEEIDSVADVFDRLSQTTLDDYGVELGNPKDSYIYWAIKERLHRAKRACVERVFSRLQEFAGLDRIRTQKEDNVETHVVLSAVALVGTALTAKRVGKPELMRSPSRIL
jgi:hypothetical protein